MRNTYTSPAPFSTKTVFLFLFALSFMLSSQLVSAQALYTSASASSLNVNSTATVNLPSEIKSEGGFMIKDGQLDEIFNLKFDLPSNLLKSPTLSALLAGKKITFEQTRVMILPMMKMVHFVGTLDVGGVQSPASFILGFVVNSDESITFNGSKTFKQNDFAKNLPNNELKLDINFVIKNSRNDLAVLTAK